MNYFTPPPPRILNFGGEGGGAEILISFRSSPPSTLLNGTALRPLVCVIYDIRVFLSIITCEMPHFFAGFLQFGSKFGKKSHGGDDGNIILYTMYHKNIMSTR